MVGTRRSSARIRATRGFAHPVQNDLAQHPRMHPPFGVIALNFLRRALRLGGVLIDRKTGRARPRHPRQPAPSVARVRRALRRSPAECARPGLQGHWTGREDFDPIFERGSVFRPGRPRSTSVAPPAVRRCADPAPEHIPGRDRNARIDHHARHFGGFSGSRVSPTPVMSQARDARHTGTSAPVSSATSSRRCRRDRDR